MSDIDETSRSFRVYRLVREAYEGARDFDWELALDDVLPGVKRRTRRKARGRIGVVLVAAAIIVVFFVPLPRLSLFNRLTTQNGRTVRTGSLNPSLSSMVQVEPTVITGADGYFWLIGTYRCSSGTCSAVMRSTDGGASFVRVGSLANSIVSLVFANRQDGYAFTTSSAASSSVFWTRDGGTTWQRIELAGRLTQLVAAGGYAYALLCASSECSSFIAVSPVTESHWTTRALPLAAKNQIVHLSASGSRLWLNLTPTGGGEARLLVSDNEGQTFSLVRSKGLSGASTLAVASSKSVLWGETLNGGMAGLSRSTDSGKNFVAFPESSSGASFLTMGARIYPLSDNEEVVADIETGLWRTEDGGRSFTRMLPNRVVLEAAFASKTNWLALGTSWSPTGVNASAAHTLWRTNDGGLSWRLLRPLQTRTSRPSVDVAATPRGWVPVAYGDAQVSVPASWDVLHGSPPCPSGSAPGEILVNPLPGVFHCPPDTSTGPRPVVWLRGIPSGAKLGRRSTENGIAVYRYLAGPAISYLAPSLGVEISLEGQLAKDVLTTLSSSPGSVVLANGPVPKVPTSWQRITFAGLSVAVPPLHILGGSKGGVASPRSASWAVDRIDWFGPGCGPEMTELGAPPAVTLDTDEKLDVPICPYHPEYAPVLPPSDGLRIDAMPTQFFPATTVHGKCLPVDDLVACPAPAYAYSVLVLSVTVPGRSKPVIVSIGLAGNGTVARTILYSLRPAAASSSTGSGNTWRADWTSVNPGSAISFATTQVGWRLDGQPYGPNIDDNLGSGIVDNGSAWPGTSISVTNNGGRTWSTILRVSTGIWGFDLVSRRVGFAVGVSTLLRTTDSGQRWTPVGEPAGHSLVWVGFGSATHGYGLTTTGTLVVSEDGGSSWTPTNLKVKGSSACFASPSVGYVIDSAGAVYATRDGGTSWAMAKNAPPRVEQFIGPWSYLSCDGSNVWVGLRLDCAAACGASFPYVVEHSSDGGVLWSSTANDWPGASRSVGPIANLADVGTGTAHGWIAVDLPTSNSPPWTWRDIRIIVYTDEGSTYQEAKVPALPETYSLAGNYVNIVRGVSFIGSTGWLYFDYTRAGSSNHPAAEPIIWRTSNGGSTWTVLATGPKQAPPPLS